MEKFFNNSHNIYYTILALGSIFGAIGYFLKLLHNIYKKLQEKYHHLELIHNKVEKIFEEITPNHGSSIKDKVNKMAERMVAIEENLSKNNNLTEKMFNRQRWMLDNDETAVFESDLNGKCIWANTKYLKLTKRHLNEVLGNGWKNIIIPEDRERVVENWESCVKDGRDSEDNFCIADSEGNRYKVFCSAHKTESCGYIGCLKILS